MKPLPDEYAPYYNRYISLIDEDVFQLLEEQAQGFAAYIRNIPENKADYAYAEGEMDRSPGAGPYHRHGTYHGLQGLMHCPRGYDGAAGFRAGRLCGRV